MNFLGTYKPQNSEKFNEMKHIEEISKETEQAEIQKNISLFNRDYNVVIGLLAGSGITKMIYTSNIKNTWPGVLGMGKLITGTCALYLDRYVGRNREE